MLIDEEVYPGPYVSSNKFYYLCIADTLSDARYWADRNFAIVGDDWLWAVRAIITSRFSPENSYIVLCLNWDQSPEAVEMFRYLIRKGFRVIYDDGWIARV